MQPTWQASDGSIKLFLGDCLTLRESFPLDAAIIGDPPYGIGLECRDEASGGVGRQNFDAIHGDTELFDPSPWLGFPDVILFGCNNFCHAIPPRQGQWYFWDKTLQNNGCRIAEGEYFWHKQGTKPRAFRHLWSGAYRASESGERSVHPSQKPIALMEWCLQHVKQRTIIDPYLGSGTTAIACARNGREFIGCEVDNGYFWKAVERINKELNRAPLFEPKQSIQRNFAEIV